MTPNNQSINPGRVNVRAVLAAVAGAALSTALWLVWWPLALGVIWSFAMFGLEKAIPSKLKRFGVEVAVVAVAGSIGAMGGLLAFGLVCLAFCLTLALAVEPTQQG